MAITDRNFQNGVQVNTKYGRKFKFDGVLLDPEDYQWISEISRANKLWGSHTISMLVKDAKRKNFVIDQSIIDEHFRKVVQKEAPYFEYEGRKVNA